MNNSCCCSGTCNTNTIPDEPWVAGTIETVSGMVPVVRTRMSSADKRGEIFCRINGRSRMKYSIDPGLYAVGNPDKDSDVLVSANYKLSFDHLRRELDGLNVWILVLDTKGINVWCAAGKGTFGTQELIERIIAVRLDTIVAHKRVIVPQLGAPGIHSHIVKKSTGFTVRFGPVYARDIKKYVSAGYKATPEMRTVRFGIADRLVLTPMEIIPSFKIIWPYLIAIMAIAGMNQDGIYFRQACIDGIPLVLSVIVAIFCGSFFVPLLLPWIPFRSFALKGWFFAIVALAVSWPVVNHIANKDLFLVIALFVALPGISSFVAFNFTGSTAFTNISGVKKELKIALPAYIIGTGAVCILVVLWKISEWGII